MTTWTIGEATEKCGLSQHTLRWYERIGLLGHIERGRAGQVVTGRQAGQERPEKALAPQGSTPVLRTRH